jgi:hypothetical protein
MASPDKEEYPMHWTLVVVLATLALIALGLAIRRRQLAIQVKNKEYFRHLLAASAGRHVDRTGIDDLPEPVRRYFRHVLPADHLLPAVTRIQQQGSLRTSSPRSRWLNFGAEEIIAASPIGFQWLARIGVGAGVSLEVCDRLIDGEASSELRLASLIRLGADSGNRQLNEAALHRFLAEAVWSPAALLPAAGVVWSAINDTSAEAKLACGETRVALEFRFNAQNEVTSVYTPARWMREKGSYRAVAWEGRYHDYAICSGVRVPMCAEVGWYTEADWCPVWKGRIVGFDASPT